MESYKELSNDRKETLTVMLKDGEKFLENNDIVGFYHNLNTVWFDEGEATLFGWVTEFLEDCGIDTVAYLKEEIPAYYSIYAPTPESLMMDGINVGIISFPPHIKKIGTAAFWCHDDFVSIDLEGVEEVGPEAFGMCKADTIIIDEKTKNINEIAFERTPIKHVVYSGMTKEQAQTLLIDSLMKNNKISFDDIEWIEKLKVNI